MNMIDHYINRRTLIVGGINSGKTTLTAEILAIFHDKGYDDNIAVLDLAPEPVNGIGGKIELPAGNSFFYLSDAILAPRLSGQNEDEMQNKASGNAMIIENLFAKLSESNKEVLFINDATLYFHAGNFSRFVETLNQFSTAVINAYYGDYFADSELTRRERKFTEDLMKICNRVIDCKDMRL